jgi:transposase
LSILIPGTQKDGHPIRCPEQVTVSDKNDNDNDTYLRTLLIHGARAVIRFAENKAEPDSWLRKLMARRNKNVAAVALANKNARIVWALLANDRTFRSDYTPAAVVAGM